MCTADELMYVCVYLLLVPIAVPSKVQNAAPGQVHEEMMAISNLGKERDFSSRPCQGPASQHTAQQTTHVQTVLHER